ncbi:MAG: putative quorum-sensing-regulated virulence factor [Akkermansiaceae bacterium]
MDFTEIDREDFRRVLDEISNFYMPYGRFGPKEFPPHGVPIFDLPPEYLQWFAARGFPKGRLGELMAVVAEIKEVGMDTVFDAMRQARGGRVSVRKRKNRRGDSEKFD